VARLDSESYYERIEAQGMIERQRQDGVKAVREALSQGRIGVRGRVHAAWILARAESAASLDERFNLAKADPDPRIQAQAVRALADLADPVLTRHRLDAGPGDADVAARLATWAPGRDPRVLREVIIALGRLRWPAAPSWLPKVLTRPDPVLAHAALQTLRRSDNWPAVLELLDRPSSEPIRTVALQALADQAVPAVVDGLIERLRADPDPARRREYADALTRVYKKPGPRPYWGYRPPPRPPNTVAWERTEAIERALDPVLSDPDRTVRLAVLRRMQREQIPTQLATLSRWLREEHEPERLAALFDSLRGHPAGATRDLLEGAIRERNNPPASRLAALALLAGGLEEASAGCLLTLAGDVEDGPVLAEVLRQLGKRPGLRASALLLDKLTARDPVVRAATVEALAALQAAEAAEPVRRLLEDQDVGVRRAAAAAAGRLNVRAAGPSLLNLARDADAGVRRLSLESLRLLKEPRVVALAVAALADPETQGAALRCLADLGGPDQANAVLDLARRDPSTEVLSLVVGMVTEWAKQAAAWRLEADRAVADLQGSAGILARWSTAGPLPAATAARLAERLASVPRAPESTELHWQTVVGTGTDARLRLGVPKADEAGAAWLTYTEVSLPEPTSVQFLTASNAGLRVWLNGRLAYQRDEARAFRPDSERFEAILEKGPNRILVHAVATKEAVEFHLRFRRKGSNAEHERLTQAALTRPGNAARGRKLFFDADKSQCVKCHRVGDQGERIGPELTGVGHRFSRIHLIESILQPSRTVLPGYQAVVVVLKDGRLLTGVRVAETGDTLTLADSQGKKYPLAKSDIEEQRPQPLSVMPEGLEKPLSVDEFVDLIAFLVSQKDDRTR
jgi:putative heme-binding domain-containing protein